MLFILASEYMKSSKGIGKVLEFAGDDLKNWSMDERATLDEHGGRRPVGTTGIIEPDEVTLEYVVRKRGSIARVRKGFTTAMKMRVRGGFRDRSATRSGRWCDARRSAQWDSDRRARGEVRIDAAYGGRVRAARWLTWTCTRGARKRARDMEARAEGVTLHSVWLAEIKQYARQRGTSIFRARGAE
jgi:3-isopropylmalate/(R)-2-methylmalate dehydratase large subunit